MLGFHPISDAPISSLANILQVIQAASIASASNFGTTQLNLRIFPSSVNSEESVSTPQINLRIFPNSFSDNVFGTASVNYVIKASGIYSSEAFGNARLAKLISAIGILSAQTFGTPILNLRIRTTGFGGETFGNATIIPGAVYIRPSGIISSNEFGTTVITFGARLIVYPQGGLKIISGKNVQKPTYKFGTADKPVFGNRGPITPKYKPPC